MDTHQTHDDAPVPHLPNDAAEGTTRREFLTHAATIGAGGSLTPLLSESAEAAGREPAPPRSQTVRLRLKVNGKERSLKLDPRVTLLDALREQMHLTGTKKGCDHGQCGACTVHVNGESVLSCLSLAASCADAHPQTGTPWSSKHLKECYKRGAGMIGWQNRKMEPRAVRQGRYLIGYGMATATYPGYRQACSARVRIYANGTATASASGNDIGTGTYTVMRQVTADVLGLPLERVTAQLGDTIFPVAPVAGGSQLTASVAPAAMEAAEMALKAVASLCIADRRSPLHDRNLDELAFGVGRVYLKTDPQKGEELSAVVKRTGKPFLEACAHADTMKSARDSQGLKQSQRPPCTPVAPNTEKDQDMDKYAFHSFGAHFCRLRVDEEMGAVRLMEWVSVMDVGKVLNPKTSRNQIMGGVTFGIGMALSEETPYDPRTGRAVARNLADYHIASHADAPDIRVEFIDAPDPHINRLGARGIGEIGITGVAACIANAVFNATGTRVRDLPLTPDKLMLPLA